MRNFTTMMIVSVCALTAACGIQGDRDLECEGPECMDPYCGDGTCGVDEHCSTCPSDCGQCAPVCGDDACNGDETCASCPSDCGNCSDPVVCGDGTCEGAETCMTCPGDCGDCPSICGDGVCDLDENCDSCVEDCGNCPVESYCGDQVCDEDEDEDCESCAADCGECPIEPFCGDDECNGDEDCGTCSADCGVCPPECGDDTCDLSEDCDSCAADCGECPDPCGDGVCASDEDCSSCETDCGECGPVCGDGVCEDPECPSTCPEDCEAECEDCGPMPDPFRSPAPGVFQFERSYGAGTTCAALRGGPDSVLPYTSWSSGFYMWESTSDPDYVELTLDASVLPPWSAGTVELNAVTFQFCPEPYSDGSIDGHESDDGTPGSDELRPSWFLFGDVHDIVRMSTEGRTWIICGWYDAATDSCDWSVGGGCGIRADVAMDWTLTPAGNMAGLSETSSGCF